MPSSCLEHAALLVKQAIDVVGHAHWLLHHQVLGKLCILEDEYATPSAAAAAAAVIVPVLLYWVKGITAYQLLLHVSYCV